MHGTLRMQVRPGRSTVAVSSRPCVIRLQAARQSSQPTAAASSNRISLASWSAALAAAATTAPHPAAAAVSNLPREAAVVSDASAVISSSSSSQVDPLAYSKETQLCITPFGIDIAGITMIVALAGAAVSGITARKRKDEAEHLNEQLRKINQSLRQQARAGTLQAPGLQYAPPNTSGSSSSLLGNGASSNGNGNGNGIATASIKLPTPALRSDSPAAAAAAAASAAPVTTMTLMSMDEEDMSAEQLECKRALKTGKALLKEQDGAAALPLFERALVLSQGIGDLSQERRATRGLAAASRLRGQHKAAIDYLQQVLDISGRMHEYTGDADAYGSIADCYTEMGDWEKAAHFYDKYIQRMESSVV